MRGAPPSEAPLVGGSGRGAPLGQSSVLKACGSVEHRLPGLWVRQVGTPSKAWTPWPLALPRRVGLLGNAARGGRNHVGRRRGGGWTRPRGAGGRSVGQSFGVRGYDGPCRPCMGARCLGCGGGARRGLSPRQPQASPLVGTLGAARAAGCCLATWVPLRPLPFAPCPLPPGLSIALRLKGARY